MNTIEINNLTRRFGRLTALDAVDLNMPKGSIFALLGPNGAGKTTLLEILLNLLTPTSGSVRTLACDSRRLGPEQFAQIGYVSENMRIHERARLRDVLGMARRLYPTWDTGFEDRLIRSFQLPLESQFRQLSRGMRVRALFVAALAFHPRLLVLDEPFGGLDPVMRDEILAQLVELAQQEGRTIVMASHDVEEVARIADHVAFLDSGRILLSGCVEALCAEHVKVVARVAAGTGDEIAPRDSWLQFQREGELVSFVAHQSAAPPSEAWEAVLGGAASVTTAALSLKEIYLAHARKAPTGRTTP